MSRSFRLILLSALVACSSPDFKSQPGLLSASTTVIDFGPVANGTMVTKSVFLLNSGYRAINLGTPTGDTLGGVFGAILERSSIQPSGDAVVDIVFSPTAVQDYQTVLTFPNDSQNDKAFQLTVKGSGITGDPCAGVTCTTPPAAVCTDPMTSRYFDPNGTCAAGKCSYNPITRTCPNGCDAATGFCAGDPCVGISCNSPPKISCIDANTSRSYNPQGTCAAGQCSYMSMDTACQYGCNPATGLCLGDACEGVSCTTPPAATCLDANTSATFNPQGMCSNAQCTYTQMTQTCQYGCDGPTGLCGKDPCIGVTCDSPPNGCFLPQGTCMNGGCTYTANNGAACDDGDPCTINDKCSQGACNGTPQMCNTPPPNACADNYTLVVYAPTAQCDQGSGTCNYTSQMTPCQYGCQNGMCKGDPCAGGCDDGNPCTTDWCDNTQGCQHQNADGNACVTGSGDCPNGICASGICQVDQTQTCVAQIQTDLCGETDVPGICASDGTCIVQQPPQNFMCPQCGTDVLCIQCTPVPGFQLTVCL